jgi:hypothetical protein
LFDSFSLKTIEDVRMKKSLMLAGLFFAIASAVAQTWDAAVVLPAAGEPQVIHLDDGTRLTLLGTTYGYRHAPPHYDTFQGWNWVNTAKDTTVVWVEAEHKTNQWPSYELLVSDQSNTACVNLEPSQGSHVKDGVDIQSFALRAYPRWDKETILRVRPYQGSISKEHFVITNPAPGAVDHWIPKPLPDTESDGNLEVTLTKLATGAPTPSWAGGILVPTNDPAKQCVHLNFDFRQNGQSTTNWQAWPVQTTDAAGNWSRGLIYDYPTNGVRQIWGRMKNGADIPPPEHYGMDGYYFQPGLWPDQPWKVRLEFIQRLNFSDDELVTFTNLPVKSGTKQDWEDQWNAWDIGKTNFPFTITPGMANGVHLKLLPPLLVPNENSPGQKYVSVIIGTDPDFNPKGMNLTVVAATDDQGRDISSPFGSPWAGHCSLELPYFRDDIKSLNLTLALHKSRFVEFIVKPEKAGPATTAR